jgi:hypothetical protein
MMPARNGSGGHRKWMVSRKYGSNGCLVQPTDLDAGLALLSELENVWTTERERTSAPAVIGIDPRLPYNEVAADIWRQMGRRRALLVRTAICQFAEAEDGIRSRGRGRDKVRNGNGNGAAHV